MTREERENALHCLKVMIDEEVCEECNLYGTTGTDHCEADCVRVAIKALEQEPTTKNCESCESCKYFGSHHEVCNYCYKCSLWTEEEPTIQNDCAEQNGCITCSLDDGDDCCRKLFEESMQESTPKNDLGVETTQMIDKSNFSQEQYKSDLQSAYDCGYAQAKNDLGVDCISREQALEPYKILKNTDTLSVYTIRQNLAELPNIGRYDPYTDKFIKE